MAKTIQNLDLYLTLVGQLDKLARHNRQGSFRTKERYYEAFKRFCAFLADEYHLQKLENISGKHLASYVLWMQESGKYPSNQQYCEIRGEHGYYITYCKQSQCQQHYFLPVNPRK